MAAWTRPSTVAKTFCGVVMMDFFGVGARA
jgi:hypothetical protein